MSKTKPSAVGKPKGKEPPAPTEPETSRNGGPNLKGVSEHRTSKNFTSAQLRQAPNFNRDKEFHKHRTSKNFTSTELRQAPNFIRDKEFHKHRTSKNSTSTEHFPTNECETRNALQRAPAALDPGGRHSHGTALIKSNSQRLIHTIASLSNITR